MVRSVWVYYFIWSIVKFVNLRKLLLEGYILVFLFNFRFVYGVGLGWVCYFGYICGLLYEGCLG